MAASYEEIDRAELDVLILHDVSAWRELHESALRRAGFGQVSAFPTNIKAIEKHLSDTEQSRRADLIIFGLQPTSELSWENLRQLRDAYTGPLLATTERHDEAAQKRAEALGISDYIAVGDFGEEALELKAETALTAHRINAMILENDLRTQRLFVNILSVMVKILENKDPYTKFHSHSVAKWSRMIGRRVGLCDEDLDNLGLAAVFHDFGKIGIPEEILCKPGRLTEDEFKVMKSHPLIARDLLSSLELLTNMIPAITHHHERWDGRGYPDGLKGEQTPLWARIIALADAYDTMASRRSYKDAYTSERIRDELVKGRGTQFDPGLVGHLESILDEHA